jgi:NADH-quinone oxidoreductase subunit E
MDGISEILNKYPQKQEYLLAILHDLQEKNSLKFLPEDSLNEVSKYLNISKSAVYGVAEYYSMFSTKPRTKHILHVCCSPVCQLAGSERLLENLKTELKGKRNITIEKCECLGHCENTPSVLIDMEFLAGSDFKSLIKQINRHIKNTGNA